MKNKIQEVVEPLKQDAINKAEQYAKELVKKIENDLKAVNWDMDILAPYPSATTSPINYKSCIAKRHFISSVTKVTWITRRINEPNTVIMDENKIARVIETAKEDAAIQYDSFVAKLIGKIGEVKSARLEGNHVWNFSILTVEKENAIVERWKTTQIINVSKFGKVFNQWPTRKIK